MGKNLVGFMKKHLFALLGVSLISGLIYLFASGLISEVFGVAFLAAGLAAPFLLAYHIDKDLFFPNWLILLWVGIMVASVGVLAYPELLHPVGFLICPEEMQTVEVTVRSEQLYDGATNTAAALRCSGAQGVYEPDSWIILGVTTALYLLLCLPVLLIAAANPLRKQGWSKSSRFAITLAIYALLLAAIGYLPELPAWLRSLTQSVLN